MKRWNAEAEMMMETIDAQLRLVPWLVASLLIVSGCLLYLQAAPIAA